MADVVRVAPGTEDAHDERLNDPARVDDVDFEPTTEFGRRLLALRRRAIVAGQPLLTREELEREVADRRGGACGCDDR